MRKRHAAEDRERPIAETRATRVVPQKWRSERESFRQRIDVTKQASKKDGGAAVGAGVLGENGAVAIVIALEAIVHWAGRRLRARMRFDRDRCVRERRGLAVASYWLDGADSIHHRSRRDRARPHTCWLPRCPSATNHTPITMLAVPSYPRRMTDSLAVVLVRVGIGHSIVVCRALRAGMDEAAGARPLPVRVHDVDVRAP